VSSFATVTGELSSALPSFSTIQKLVVGLWKRLYYLMQRPDGEASVCDDFDNGGMARAELEAEASAAFESSFANERKVDFVRFRDDFMSQLPAAIAAALLNEGVDALTVWTHIRSFLVGSVEAVLHKERTGAWLSLEDYLDPEVFSYGRCRVVDTAKRSMYRVFVKYREYLEATVSWDDTDLIQDVALRLRRHYRYHELQPEQLRHAGSLDTHTEPLYDRIYIDEVQVKLTRSMVLIWRDPCCIYMCMFICICA
jgi:hypothetical protein